MTKPEPAKQGETRRARVLRYVDACRDLTRAELHETVRRKHHYRLLARVAALRVLVIRSGLNRRQIRAQLVL